MKIQSVAAIPVAASFKSTFRFGTTDRTTSPNVVVIIRTSDGAVGYGEARPVPAFTGETQKSIVELVEQRVAPLFIGRDPAHRLPLLHLAAALPQLSYPSYLMGPLKYRQRITEQQVEVVDGCVAVPAGPGIGFTVDELRSLDARTQS